LTLDSAAGPQTTTITVTGSQFFPNESLTLEWDPPSTKVAGSVTTDGGGAFTTTVRPYPGDSLGLHKLCATVAPVPCADFTLTAAVTSPSPVPTPAPSPSPSPSPSAPAVVSPVRIGSNPTVLDLLTRPPLVFVPIAGLVAILLAAGYWALVVFLRRPRPVQLPSAAIVHRASRPDYTASFGTAPEPPTPQPMPSAWAHVAPAVQPPPQPPAPPPAEAPPPPYPPAPPADMPEPPGLPPGPPDPAV